MFHRNFGVSLGTSSIWWCFFLYRDGYGLENNNPWRALVSTRQNWSNGKLTCRRRRMFVYMSTIGDPQIRLNSSVVQAYSISFFSPIRGVCAYSSLNTHSLLRSGATFFLLQNIGPKIRRDVRIKANIPVSRHYIDDNHFEFLSASYQTKSGYHEIERKDRYCYEGARNGRANWRWPWIGSNSSRR